jgi:hypothetical protein
MRIGMAALCVSLLAPAWCRAEDTIQREYAIKAAFLYRMARYVEWPAPAREGDFILGVLGRNPFGGFLRHIARRKTVRGRPIKVRYFPTLKDLEHCHMLFLSKSMSGSLKEILKKVGREPTLVIADGEGLAGAGAPIGFYITRGRVRFEINIEAARRAGLKISAKLLRLARIVEERDPQGRD